MPKNPIDRTGARHITLAGISTSVVAIAVVAISSLYRARAVVQLPKTVSSVIAAVAPKMALPPIFRSEWLGTKAPPTVITIAGKEAVVGVVRMEDDQLYVVATESAGAQRLWRYGPLGAFGVAQGATIFGAAAGKVVVADFRSNVHLVDSESGNETANFHLTDRANAICFAKAAAWIGTVDHRGFAVDLTAGSAHAAPRPGGCEDAVTSAPEGLPSAHEAVRAAAPRVAGFLTKRVFSDGNVSVASGIRSPGTEIPRAVGFDPKSKAVLWNATLFAADPATVRSNQRPHDDLAGGRYVGVYELEPGQWHLAALDAKNGAHLWDTEMRSVHGVDWINFVRATTTHVYVVRMSSLEIYDATRGARIGVIGSEIYKSRDD
jgi:outer membrane protein assembly factor BamB